MQNHNLIRLLSLGFKNRVHRNSLWAPIFDLWITVSLLYSKSRLSRIFPFCPTIQILIPRRTRCFYHLNHWICLRFRGLNRNLWIYVNLNHPWRLLIIQQLQRFLLNRPKRLLRPTFKHISVRNIASPSIRVMIGQLRIWSWVTGAAWVWIFLDSY